MIHIMPIVSIYLPDKLLDKMDEYARRYGFTSRSELIREALRELIEGVPAEEERGRIYGILIVLTDHSKGRYVDEKVVETIHSFQFMIKSFYHQLLEGDWCLNIAIIDAHWTEIQAILRTLRKTRGVAKTWFIPFRVEHEK